MNARLDFAVAELVWRGLLLMLGGRRPRTPIECRAALLARADEIGLLASDEPLTLVQAEIAAGVRDGWGNRVHREALRARAELVGAAGLAM